MSTAGALPRVEAWLARRGWSLFDFQCEVADAYLAGESGLLHAPTGSGKTLAVWLGPLLEALDLQQPSPGLSVLWLTPLRALAADTLASLREITRGCGLDWRIEARTGDTHSALRKRQRENPPQGLITTPESLSVLLSSAETATQLRQVRCVIVDEWRELMASKRGVQLELCLAHLRAHSPLLRTWGLSATLGNLEQARDVLLGPTRHGRLVRGPAAKQVIVDSILPASIERFGWSGHLGLALLEPALRAIEASRTTLLFTNTRSQAEIWYQAIVERRLDWLTQVALHHGSIGQPLRRRIEAALKGGKLKCVVCTSSLDLGVDFSPVDQVIQVGSPKGVARLMQRAGRSGHQPGVTSRVLCLPAHAFELLEIAGARAACAAGRVESREPIVNSLDVLVQHLMSLACGPGFEPGTTLAEVRNTHAFAALAEEDWRWAIGFLERGGSALAAYPQYHRIRLEADGRYVAAAPHLARTHRLGIGTISSDESMQVRWFNGRVLGTIEESFISRLREGDVFLFAGRRLALARVKDMTAYVRPATRRTRNVPRWQGGRMPLSTELADATLELFTRWQQDPDPCEEVRLMKPLLELQQRVSKLPHAGALLIERTRTREGSHLFVFPFAGRLAHEGLATLLAMRLGRRNPSTFTLSYNDYGFELLGDRDVLIESEALAQDLRRGDLAADLLACVNVSEGAKRAFRDIARIAGLIQQGLPGRGRSQRQVQASAALIFDVLTQFDPANRLLDQARAEVLARQLEGSRLAACLRRLETLPLVVVDTEEISPLAFPLWAERLQSQVISSESWKERVARMAAHLEKSADESRDRLGR
ncbi:MAG: ligase-associated DNA damage response DEXH box helicase [Steroidobacteraceae bacterium]